MAKRPEPFLLINFKAYLESTGKRAIELARKLEAVSQDTGIKVGVAVQFSDIERVVAHVKIPVYAQHIDPVTHGAFTGHVLAETVAAAGATGTIVNHSERPLRLAEIERAVEHAREVGLTTVVCAGTAKLGAALSLSEPDMVAIEPPELIGSGRAVSKEKPEVITESVSRIRAVNSKVQILCGAGITTAEDVYAALKLGTEGVLVASGVVKAADPQKVLREFCEAVMKYRSF